MNWGNCRIARSAKVNFKGPYTECWNSDIDGTFTSEGRLVINPDNNITGANNYKVPNDSWNVIERSVVSGVNNIEAKLALVDAILDGENNVVLTDYFEVNNGTLKGKNNFQGTEVRIGNSTIDVTTGETNSVTGVASLASVNITRPFSVNGSASIYNSQVSRFNINGFFTINNSILADEVSLSSSNNGFGFFNDSSFGAGSNVHIQNERVEFYNVGIYSGANATFTYGRREDCNYGSGVNPLCVPRPAF